MSYTTFAFLVFFTIVLLLRYCLPTRLQTGFLLVAGYVFYMWAKPAFGLLLAFDTMVAWLIGRKLAACRPEHRRQWLLAGIIPLFGLLFVFKYLDFFLGSMLGFTGLFSGTLSLALPVGISFYTFCLTGYLFDVYRKTCEPERNLLVFGIFASFFPTILSGPICRANLLLPQIRLPAQFCEPEFRQGLLRFLWGAGKKLIAADLLGVMVNGVYQEPQAYAWHMLLAAAAAYSLQIYLDFSAYSDMAVGVGRMLGFRLPENFSAPYFSRSVQNFWKKWHISLTSWFRDYLYFPLGGSRRGQWKTYRNLLIVFAVSGLWHGAAMNFVIWGLLNGFYQVVGRLTLPARQRIHRALHLKEEGAALTLWQGLVTFSLITAAWIFFRAESLAAAVGIFQRIFVFAEGKGLFSLFSFWSRREILVLFVWLMMLTAEEIRHVKKLPAPAILHKPAGAWIAAAILALLVLVFGAYGPGFNAQDFVYFRF